MDALFDAIVAEPHDDAPRLVWADREGGERGEFVVVQCALARELPRPERHRLVRRERELYDRNATRWSPFGGNGTSIFRRGFVEGVQIQRTMLENILVVPPLVRELVLEDDPSVRPMSDWERPRVRAQVIEALARFPAEHVLALHAPAWTYHCYGDDFTTMVGDVPALRGLRSLTIGHAEGDLLLAPLARLTRLSDLDLRRRYIPADELSAFLGAAPQVRGLRVQTEVEVLPAVRHLRELDIGVTFTDDVFAAVATMPALERLSLRFESDHDGGAGFDAFASGMPRLVDLVIDGFLPIGVLERLTRSAFAPRLRRMTITETVLEAAHVTALLTLPALEVLVLGAAPAAESLARLAAEIPRITSPSPARGRAREVPRTPP